MKLKTSANFPWLLILSLAVVGHLATELYLPSLPDMAKYFNVPIHLVQLSISIYVLGFAFGGLLYGGLSDKFGRVPIVLTSLLIATGGSLICVFMFNLKMLYIGRFIQGVGLSGTGVMTRAICRDLAKSPTNLSQIGSIIGMSATVALCIAPIAGGYIETYSFWRMCFILLAIINIAILVFSKTKLKETNQNVGQITFKGLIRGYFIIFTNLEFLCYSLISGLAFGGVVAYQTLSAKLLEVDLGLNPQHFGLTAIFITLAFLSGGYLNSIIVVKRGFNKMVRWGLYLFLISGILDLIFGLSGYVSLISIILPTICYMLGASIVYPNASTGSMRLYPQYAGISASAFNFIRMVCGALGSTLVSLNKNSGELSIAMLYIGITAICLFLFNLRKNIGNSNFSIESYHVSPANFNNNILGKAA